MKLHRIHAAVAATRVEFDTNGLSMTWRGEGKGGLALKAEIARRLAICWNVCEGMPIEALEAGLIRDVFNHADALVAGLEDDLEGWETKLGEKTSTALAALRDALNKCDTTLDRTDGRLNDCESCAPDPEATP